MALPPGWRQVDGSLVAESGQAWVHQVCRSDAGGDATCALKRLKNPDRRERFRREVETMRRLAADGLPVPPVVEHDLDADRPWFVMPWYPQGSLQGLIGSMAQDAGLVQRLRLVDRVALALQLLHAAGVAHRDVKPSNVLLSGEDVLLADLGLCLPVDDGARLTDTGEAVGSRLYIAPENESGLSEVVDQRPADFYGFAKLAWAVIASRNPPARELQVQSGYRLEALLGDDRLAGLTPLFERLLNTDPRARLTDWTVVRGELSAALSLYDERTQSDVADKLEYAAALAAASRFAEKRGAEEKRKAAARMEERRRHAGEIGRVLQHELSRRLQDDLHRLSEAGRGEITFNVSSAGSQFSELLERGELAFLRERSFESFSLEATSPALVAVSWSGARPLDSHVYLGIYVLVEGDSLWLLRVPVMYGAGEQGIAVRDLVSGSIRAEGPFPLGLVSTQATAARFARETATIGMQIAVRCVSLIDEGKDPLTLERWHLPQDPL